MNSTADISDPNPGDGIVGDGITRSLRASLEEANAGSAITVVILPGPHRYQLTRGALRIAAVGLTLTGIGNPEIDGILNPFGSSLLVVSGDSNQIAGITFIRSGGSALVISGKANIVGPTITTGESNFFFTNSLQRLDGAAIEITATALKTTIVSNWIGVAQSGDLFPNRLGIAVRGASGTTIGSTDSLRFNRISGNDSHGIFISENARSTMVLCNRIGLSASDIIAAPNQGDGIHIDASSSTQIGLQASSSLAVSGNKGDGIFIGDFATDITFGGLRIGTDLDSDQPIGNDGNGVSIQGECSGIRFGAGALTVIASNGKNGIVVHGPLVRDVQIYNAHIGASQDGFRDLPNGGDGIRLSNTRHIIIGERSSSQPTLISGNLGAGIGMYDGTNGTLVQNAIIGLARNGTSSMANATGVLIAEGCHNNRIGENLEFGNLISGNRGEVYPQGAGILLYGEGCEDNSVRGNLIGTDITGTRAARNGTAGIMLLNGAARNTIGGITEDEENIISGNGNSDFTPGLGRGIHLSGPGTTQNRILGNRIGTGLDGTTPLGNTGHGIGLYAGASENVIAEDNIIAFNRGVGIYLQGESVTQNHFERVSSVFNDSGQIRITSGANNNQPSPVILSAQFTSLANGTVSGLVEAGEFNTIEFYLFARNNPNPQSRMTRLGTVQTADGSIVPYSFSDVALVVQFGDTLVALATDAAGNSSGYSLSFRIDEVLGYEEETEPSIAPLAIYPNPTAGEMVVSFALEAAQEVSVDIYNLLGQRVQQLLLPQRFEAGTHVLQWNGRDDKSQRVGTGVYFVRVHTGEEVQTRQIVRLR